MKKLISVLLALLLVLSMSTCGAVKDVEGNKVSKEDRQYVKKAIELVNEAWKSRYSEFSDRIKTDGTIEIINTRLIKIKDNDTEIFKDIGVVVEFDIFSDWHGSAPYYENAKGVDDSVAFYKDGTAQVWSINPFNAYAYGTKTYSWDFSGIIDSIAELGPAYNTDKIKTVKISKEKEQYVSDAIDTLTAGWEEFYRTNEYSDGDGTLKIINTRLLMLNDSSSYPDFDEYFGDIEAIVEFELYSDYYGSAPYYSNVQLADTVIVHKDGTLEPSRYNLIRTVRAKTSNWDFSDVFSEIDELGTAYNQTFRLLD